MATDSPPFASKGGTVPDGPSTTKGTDFSATENANGQSIRGGARDFGRESRLQGTPVPPGQGIPSWMYGRKQIPITAKDRVAPESIPEAGEVMQADPGPAAVSVGAQGLSRPKPFKNMK